MTSKLRVLVPLLLVLAACGGDDSPSSDPVDQATASDYCQQGCEHQHECDATTDVNACVSSCVDDAVGVFRGDVFVDFATCVNDLPCGTNDDACYAQTCEPIAAHETYEADCRERLAMCDLSAEQIDDTCETDPSESSGVGSLLCAVAPTIVDEFDACFDETDCLAILQCFQEVRAAHGIET